MKRGVVLTSTDRASYDLSYDVIERASGSVVLVGHTSLACQSAADVPATAPGAVAPDLAPSAAALASPRILRTSGLRIHPRDGDRDIANALIIGGFGVAAGAALTLIGIGVATGIQVSPVCRRWSTPASSVSAYGSPAPTPGASYCLDYSGPRPATTPADLSWTMLGLIGGGVAVGVIGLIVQALIPSPHDRGPRMLVDVGPTGASAGLTLSF